MSIFITLIAALIVFSAVIAIHEFGHFTVAKLCGIQVNEFSIGMGPALWKKIYKGTQYSLRALPVGGYVALEGEESPESQQAEAARDEREAEDENPVPPEQRTGIPLNEASVWQRVLVMVAGAFMNFVLGFVVLVILVAAQEGAITSKTIYSIENDALCGQTGLQAGDEIVAVNGRRCFVANDILYELVRTEAYRARFTVKRDGCGFRAGSGRSDHVADRYCHPQRELGYFSGAVRWTVCMDGLDRVRVCLFCQPLRCAAAH